MNDFQNGAKRMEGVWKWIAAILLAWIVGMYSGRYEPNRQIVTRDDLAPLSQQISSTNQKVDQISNDVSEMKGALKAQALLRDSK